MIYFASMSSRFLFLPLIISFPLFGQGDKTCQPCPPATKLEAFLAQREAIVVKTLSDLGEVGPVKCQALVAWELGRRRFPTSGVIVTIIGEKGGMASVIVDEDELTHFSRALWHLATFTDGEGGLPETGAEMTFSTRSDLRLLAFRSGAGNRVRATATISTADHREIRCSLDGQQLNQLKDLADRAPQLFPPR
jgi:hypothetical protein